ncbi:MULTISPECIES: CheR family methyltransferase [Haloarcula]|uniref:protein-glutamate O-methyltransferase n=1 Tax=Haloarcula pellucida TaxID=1427151 RepID=A0A830GNL5_9EURY|nr:MULTISPECIES: protein-glutamate O-methyltransferase CheR [Halomicroarcula]MBX0349138.1 protein-glutamate O-methyltransferase CheR [Halomicroarcula pellucida]MDS0279269.1 protein-glutamate O-methyltransferase CheR [Halomicroarcula sp. S1AR25-4]GGN99210.1 chemotaxis protein CheR [Halomicroarcula pellucida]
MSKGNDRQFHRLLEFIGSEMDFESGFYNDAYLDRRITARMRRTDTETYREYKRLLERDDGEREQLLDSLSINVTGFFRNPEAWEHLRPVLRDLTAENRRVRLWSAPSADGREPYSAAMLALDDPEVDDSRIEITGTDINADILREARRGTYETSQTTDIAEELAPLDDYSEYVEEDGNTFRVRDNVTDMVTFQQHDLIRGDPKRDFDLVFCRNLLIYIDTEYKVPIFETIRGSLREGGYLMIGMTETLPTECRDAFEPVDKQHRIYRRV